MVYGHDQLQVGWTVAWSDFVIDEFFRTTLTLSGGAGGDDPRLRNIPRPTTGKYLGRTKDGIDVAFSEDEAEVQEGGADVITDSESRNQRVVVSGQLAFNQPINALKTFGLPPRDLEIEVFFGGRTARRKRPLLLGITNTLHEDPDQRLIIYYLMFFNGHFSASSFKFGPGHNNVNFTYKGEAARNGEGCLYAEGMQLGHIWATNVNDPSIIINPEAPDVPVGSNPQTPTPLGAQLYMQL